MDTGKLQIVSWGDRQRVIDIPRTATLRNRNVVFVVDDDPGMLKGLKRLLREHGYDSVVFSSAEEFQNHDDFESACCVVLDINLNDKLELN